MQVESTRLPQQLHVRFRGQLIALAPITGVAAGNQVLPGGSSATGTRHHMVEGQLAGGQYSAAVLAAVAVAQEDILAGKGPALVGNAAVLQQADDRGHADGK